MHGRNKHHFWLTNVVVFCATNKCQQVTTKMGNFYELHSIVTLHMFKSRDFNWCTWHECTWLRTSTTVCDKTSYMTFVYSLGAVYAVKSQKHVTLKCRRGTNWIVPTYRTDAVEVSPVKSVQILNNANLSSAYNDNRVSNMCWKYSSAR